MTGCLESTTYTQYPLLLLMAEILHQLIGRLSHYLQGFIHPRWCRISSINGSCKWNYCVTPIKWPKINGLMFGGRLLDVESRPRPNKPFEETRSMCPCLLCLLQSIVFDLQQHSSKNGYKLGPKNSTEIRVKKLIWLKKTQPNYN